MDRSRIARVLLAGLAVTLGSCMLLPGGEEPPAGAPRLQERLGATHHPITTTSELAQRYFDQGLVLTFGFNHAGALDAFRAASELDPTCAMCFWGIGYALGPNINWPMGPEAGREAWAASRAALGLAARATEKERAYVEALALRYAEEPPEDRAPLDLAYANAMRDVAARFPDDLDARTLFAESLMDLYPWNYWTSEQEPREYTEEMLEQLEAVLEVEPNHPGANHYYIHATEEYFPERAEAAADRLTALGLETGHLVHMPSHIYWRVGRYDDATEVNKKAAAADEAYFGWCRPGVVYRALYYPHNVHFLWAAASAEGQSGVALSAARKLEASVEDFMEEMPFVQEFASVALLTLARFGQWDAVLGEPAPPEDRRFLVGVRHYARGLAFTRRGDAAAAAAELEALRAVVAEPGTVALIVAGGTAPASQVLSIGVAHLEGEMAAAAGDTATAVARLESAVAQQDTLVYMEPPPWYFPTRQALGAVLLDAGRAEEAEAVYLADLEQYPKNGWSLFGLSESYDAQGKAAEAGWAREGFRNAFARADVELGASRF